ncbi:MAG: hypothetical protein PHD06_12325 [Bacteroidales bacterium]|jgi:hypothetical protein|nr:hypothetical protein [Bacteroidales bacterium]MDY0197776.1 hypothetical protein [Tenuifilaceae bacterium]
MKRFFITALALFFTLLGYSQEANFKVICAEDSSVVDFATFLLFPSNDVFITNSQGTFAVDSTLFFGADSLWGSHIAYGVFSIIPANYSTMADTIVVSLKKKYFDIAPVVVRPERLKRIISGMISKWEIQKPKNYRNSLGIFSTVVSEKDSLCLALVCDAVGFWGDNHPDYYSKIGIESLSPHFGVIPLGTMVNSGFKTLNLSNSGPEVLTSNLRAEDLTLAEKFIYSNGPIEKKYKRYYSYSLDSIFWDKHNAKHFAISFESKAKASRKNILCGKGHIVLNADYTLKEVKLLNPDFPMPYPHSGIHYRRKDSGFTQQINVSFANANDTIYPVHLRVESHYSNGRSEFAQYTLTTLISPLTVTNGSDRKIFSALGGFFNRPLLSPPAFSSTNLTLETSKLSNAFGVKLIPLEKQIWFSELRFSFPEQTEKFITFYKQVTELLWTRAQEYY